MASLYDALKASRSQRFPDYFTLLWGRKLSAKMIKTLTGTLPLNFRTSETALRSWTIYGNNNAHSYSAEGTLPLTFTTHTAGAASDWSIEGNDENGTENLVPPIRIANGWKQGYRQKGNGNYTSTHNNGEWLYDVYIPIDSTSFTFWATATSSTAAGTFYFYTHNKNYIPNTTIDINNYNNETISSLPADAAYMQFAFRTYHRSEQEIIDSNYQVMLVKGSTAPDHYIPYQQGVGQRTANLYNPDATDVNNGYVNPGRLRPDGTINKATVAIEIWVTEYIAVESEHVYTLVDITLSSVYGVCYYDANKNYISGVAYNIADHGNKAITTPADCKYIRFTVAEGYDTMLVEGSTAPATFVPYGYEIPISVNGTLQDIYIGDTPLTAGQSISKTSTGIDIAAIAGSNTVTTDLYNKPSMSIEGVDYVGVGAVSGDKYLIRVINSANISPYKPNAPESNTSYVYNDSTYTLDTDSQFKTALISWQGGSGNYTITKAKGSTFKLEGLTFMGNWGGEDHYIRTTVITPTGTTYSGSISGSYLLITYYDSEVDTLTPREIRESITVSASVNSSLTLPVLDAPLTEGETLTIEDVGHDFTTFAGVENTIEPFNPEVYDYGDFEMSITYKGG